ncbi:MAG TPA: 6-phosphogluconolactonase [Terriglobales bacterium]
MTENFELRILPDVQAIAQVAADEFARLAQAAVHSRGVFTVALPGGSTPRALFSLLAERTAKKVPPELPWSQTQLFFSDERHVPPNHVNSNFRTANEFLLSRVPVPQWNVHRVRAEEPDASFAASEYERELAEVFKLEGDAQPRFDLIFVGMGADGHTASLFPGTRALHEMKRRVAANWVPKLNTFRITFTRPLIDNAAEVVLMVSGADKAEALAAAMDEGSSPEEYPVKYVQPKNGKVLWLVDQAAAEKLKPLPAGRSQA